MYVLNAKLVISGTHTRDDVLNAISKTVKTAFLRIFAQNVILI